MKQFRIDVTQDNISQAVRKDSHHCMLADAIQSQIPWAKYIMVDLQSIRFTNKDTGKRYIYMTPPIAQKAIIDFDLGKPAIRSFRFVLNKGHERGMRVLRALNPAKRKTRHKKSSKHGATRVMPSVVREYGVRQLTEANF